MISVPNITPKTVLDRMVVRGDAQTDNPFYSEFESVRLAAVASEVASVYLKSGNAGNIRVLDFGYLTGLVPRTLLELVPLDYVVVEHPQAPVFKQPEQRQRAESDGILLVPCALETDGELARTLLTQGQFDVILLGEIIEHLDPTVTARLLASLRPKLRPTGRLIVTTPNLFAIANTARHLIGKDVQAPPVGHEIMVQGHIHLWSPSALAALGLELGFRQESLFYYHGLEGTQYVQSNREWRSLSYQVWRKCLHFAAVILPRWRGFFVASYSPL